MQMSTPIEKIPDDPRASADEDAELVQSIMADLKSQEMSDTASSVDGPQAVPAYNADDMYDSQPDYDDDVDVTPPPATEPSRTLWRSLWLEAKEPVIVLLLSVLFGLPLVDRILTRYMPRFSADGGTLNTIGVICKAIVITIVFFMLKKFVR